MLKKQVSYLLMLALVVVTMPAFAMPIKHNVHTCSAVEMQVMHGTHHAHHAAVAEKTTCSTKPPCCEKNCQCAAGLCHTVQFLNFHTIPSFSAFSAAKYDYLALAKFPAKLIAQIERPPKV